MKTVIGIDVGISTTKIVGVRDNQVVAPIRISAADPITSLYGAFGKYLYNNKIHLQDVERVMLTGVGAAYVKDPIYGLPTEKTEEFKADGLGARFVSGLDRTIVVSMGTGTSFVKCEGSKMEHIGGIAMGGGTLQGLSRVILGSSDIQHVSQLAENGDVTHVNLMIRDISAEPLPGLPMDTTASLFARAQNDAHQEDLAAGLICMVLQTIGSTSVLVGQGCDIKDFVLIGQLTLLPQCRMIFPALERLYKVKFHIPKYSDFCTAIGAGLAGIRPL